MFPLIPYRDSFGSARAVAITRHDLIKAHNQAPEPVNAMSMAQGRHSRAQALNLVLAYALPLVGYLFLHWSALLITLSLLLDYATNWLSDRLRHRWDPELVETEISRAADAQTAVTAATALKYPGRMRRGTRDHPERRVLVLYVPKSDELSSSRRSLQPVVIAFLSIVLPLITVVGIVLISVKPRDYLPALALMLTAALINLGLARYQSIHAAVDGTPNPQLYPQATASLVVLSCGPLLFGLVAMLVSAVSGSSFIESHDLEVIGGVYLSCFFAVSGCIAVISQERNARWSRVLSEFAETGRERLLATLSSFNAAAEHESDLDPRS
jgi:hypothetical protein